MDNQVQLAKPYYPGKGMPNSFFHRSLKSRSVLAVAIGLASIYSANVSA